MANRNSRRGSRDAANRRDGGYPKGDGYQQGEGRYPDDGYASDEDWNAGYPSDDGYPADDGYSRGGYQTDDGYPADNDYAVDDGYSAGSGYSRGGYQTDDGYSADDGHSRSGGYQRSSQMNDPRLDAAGGAAGARASRSSSRTPARSSSRTSSQSVASRSDRALATTGAASRSSSDRGLRRTGGDPDRFSRRAASNRYTAQRKKGSRKKKIILAIVCVILAIVGVGAAWAANYVHNLNKSMVIDQSDSMYNALEPAADNASAQDPFYMLLMGTDESAERDDEDIYGGAYRSDSIILARVDPQNKIVTLISIHRDTVVDLSAYGGTGQDKINSAYVYGGKELMISTISDFAGVPISHYAEIDFDGFEAVVDALGGIDVDVEMTFYDPQLEEGLEGGEQTLNGEQALLYARARHAFDDYGDGDRYRAKHQRQVLTAIAQKLLASNVATMTSTISTLAQYIQTDMDVSTIVSIASSFAGVDASKCIYSCMEPTTSEYTDGTWYERVDQEAWDTMMQEVEAGKDPGEDSAIEDLSSDSSSSSTTTASASGSSGSVAVKNGSEYAGAASSAASTITAAGYTVSDTGDADSSDYGSTLVIYSDSAYQAEAEAIASALGVGSAMASDGSYNMSTDVLVVIGADWNG